MKYIEEFFELVGKRVCILAKVLKDYALQRQWVEAQIDNINDIEKITVKMSYLDYQDVNVDINAEQDISIIGRAMSAVFERRLKQIDRDAQTVLEREGLYLTEDEIAEDEIAADDESYKEALQANFDQK